MYEIWNVSTKNQFIEEFATKCQALDIKPSDNDRIEKLKGVVYDILYEKLRTPGQSRAKYRNDLVNIIGKLFRYIKINGESASVVVEDSDFELMRSSLLNEDKLTDREIRETFGDFEENTSDLSDMLKKIQEKSRYISGDRAYAFYKGIDFFEIGILPSYQRRALTVQDLKPMTEEQVDRKVRTVKFWKHLCAVVSQCLYKFNLN